MMPRTANRRPTRKEQRQAREDQIVLVHALAQIAIEANFFSGGRITRKQYEERRSNILSSCPLLIAEELDRLTR